jgi:hypothetical protein
MKPLRKKVPLFLSGQNVFTPSSPNGLFLRNLRNGNVPPRFMTRHALVDVRFDVDRGVVLLAGLGQILTGPSPDGVRPQTRGV